MKGLERHLVADTLVEIICNPDMTQYEIVQLVRGLNNNLMRTDKNYQEVADEYRSKITNRLKKEEEFGRRMQEWAESVGLADWSIQKHPDMKRMMDKISLEIWPDGRE